MNELSAALKICTHFRYVTWNAKKRTIFFLFFGYSGDGLFTILWEYSGKIASAGACIRQASGGTQLASKI